MLRKTLILAGTLLVTPMTALAQGDSATSEAPPPAASGKYAHVNGIDLYYETYGTGAPLVLLHGGLGAIEMFGPLLPALAQNRQVIAVDLQGHGRTADIDRPMTYENMADDVAALMTSLKLDKADVMGYSLGGGVALQVAIRHPEVARKLVLMSTAFKRDGWYPEVLQGMGMMSAANANMMTQTPMYQLYAAIAPRPEQWPTTVDKLGKLLGTDYDWTAGVEGLKMPVLILVGDADSVRLDHAVEMFHLLGGAKVDGASLGRPAAQLGVLTDTTHFTIFADAARVAPVVGPFLDAPMPK
jgi:pimeloyl-ACP methyl ester carboxylesterase